MKMSQIAPNSADSLPKQFVVAMRTLFDIMDDKKTGYVKFSDIEHRWRDDGNKGIPRGVIDSLHKVTPPDGLLSFERFCTGLKICLLRNQTDNSRQSLTTDNNQQVCKGRHLQTKSQPHRPPSVPILDVDDPPVQHSNWNPSADTIRTSHVNVPQQRTISMPQLTLRQEPNVDGKTATSRYNGDNLSIATKLQQSVLYGPPKPPRVAASIEKNSNLDKPELNSNMQQWKQQHAITLEKEQKLDLNVKYMEDPIMLVPRGGRESGDGKPATEQPLGIYQKKANVRRREPRRHTLQNGIDYNMLKRMKQIEQEKDILVQGLAAIEKAREWYLKQLSEVQDKLRYSSRMGTPVEQWTESQQERLELQRARVMELNRQLDALAECWQRGGLSLHMNLALAPQTANAMPAHAANRLKHQNHLLTEEVSKKSDRITVLEREKSGLIRELLQLTNRNKNVENVF